jgi:uncharacterized protein (TIGR02246 family)
VKAAPNCIPTDIRSVSNDFSIHKIGDFFPFLSVSPVANLVLKEDVMKYPMILVVGICLFVCPAPAMADRTEDEAAIRMVMEQMDRAYERRDPEAMSSYMAEDYVSWLGNHKGREVNVEIAMEELKNQKNLKYERSDEIGIDFVTHDVAIYKAHWNFTGAADARGNTLPPRKLLGACVMVRRDGRWQMVAFFSRSVGK